MTMMMAFMIVKTVRNRDDDTIVMFSASLLIDEINNFD